MASSSAVLCLSFREAHTSRRHSVSQGWIPGPRRKPCRPSKIESICSQVEFHFSVLWGFDRCFEKLSSLALTEISLVHTSATDCSLCLRNHIFFFFCTLLFRGQQDCQSHMFWALSLRPKSMTNNNNNPDRDHGKPFTLCLLCAGLCRKFTFYSQQPTEV